MILVYRNVNTGALSYGLEDLSGSYLADGRAVPASPVWESHDDIEIDEAPPAVVEVLRARAEAKLAAEETARTVAAAEASAKAARDAAYARWYNDPRQVAARRENDRQMVAALNGLRRALASLSF